MRLLAKYRAWRAERERRSNPPDALTVAWQQSVIAHQMRVGRYGGDAFGRLLRPETARQSIYRLVQSETDQLMRAALLDLARDVEREEALGRMQGWEWSHDELRAMLDAAQPDIERESVLGDVPPIAASSDPRCRVVLLEPLG